MLQSLPTSTPSSIPASAASAPSPQATAQLVPPLDTLAYAKSLIEQQITSLQSLLGAINSSLAEALLLCQGCQGRIVITGMGKSGLIGQKISATLASTGTPSWYVHAAEMVHGDLGRLHRQDVLLVLSNSGASPEIVRLLPIWRSMALPVIAMTADLHSPLATMAQVVLHLGAVKEACPMALAPTSSTTAMLVLGDALALTLAHQQGFDMFDYGQLHPGGSLGRRLRRVEDVMRIDRENPKATPEMTIAQVIALMTQTPGRPGAASIVDSQDTLLGFFTDGDMRRLLLQPGYDLHGPITQVMQTSPKTVAPDRLVQDVLVLFRRYQIDQLPVVDACGRLVGLLDIQDVVPLKESQA